MYDHIKGTIIDNEYAIRTGVRLINDRKRYREIIKLNDIELYYEMILNYIDNGCVRSDTYYRVDVVDYNNAQ